MERPGIGAERHVDRGLTCWLVEVRERERGTIEMKKKGNREIRKLLRS